MVKIIRNFISLPVTEMDCAFGEGKFWRAWRPRCRFRSTADVAARLDADRRDSAGVAIRVPGEPSVFCRDVLGFALDEWQAKFVDAPVKRKVVESALTDQVAPLFPTTKKLRGG